MFQLDVDTILKKKNKTRYWLFNELNSITPISSTNFYNMVDNRTKSIKYENLYKRKFDSFNSLNVTKVLQTLYFFVKFLFFSCTMSHNVI